MKKAAFHPKARLAIQQFPDAVRRELGKAIFDLQMGAKLSMPLSKHMRSIASGAEELRVKDKSGAYRVFYYTRFEGMILIFHAFTKKTQKTPKHEIELGAKRLKEILNEKD